LRFADAKEVDARANELGKIVVAWCDLMSTPGGGRSRKR
jgi:hypothetical protein